MKIGNGGKCKQYFFNLYGKIPDRVSLYNLLYVKDPEKIFMETKTCLKVDENLVFLKPANFLNGAP